VPASLQLWSDGPASQFKNRYVFNYMKRLIPLLKLKNVQWNFFSTSHGKGAVDGIGGTAKRTVWRRVKARLIPNVECADQFVAALVANESHLSLKTLTTADINAIHLQFCDIDDNCPQVAMSY
jgi:hypothetical protein